MGARLALVACIAALIAADAAAASPGDLDTSFGNGGTVVVDMGNDQGGVRTAMAADGSILIASSVFPLPRNIGVARVSANGVLDTSFGTSGVRIVDLGSDDGSGGASVAVQPDGRVVVAASTPAGPNPFNFGVARLSAGGAIEAGFGSAGVRLIDFFVSPNPASDDVPRDLTIAPDGGIIVAGDTELYGPGRNYAVARLSPSSAVDWISSGSIGADESPTTVSVQADGKIVSAGFTEAGPNPTNIGVTRIRTDGFFDPTFTGGGPVAYDLGTNNELAYDSAIQPDGKIVISGYADPGASPGDAFVMRLNADGTPDGSFGSGGVAMLDFGGDEFTGYLALQPDGKIVVTTTTGPFGAYQLGLARLNPDGSLDSSFAGGGKRVVDLDQSGAGTPVVLQPDGRIVVGFPTAAGVNPDNAALARFEGDPPPPPGPGPTAACSGKTATITGTEANEKLAGTDGKDVVAAFGGNDKVNAGKGNDTVCLGAGNDKASGGPGKDKLLGENGKDRLKGQGGKDKLVGGKGKDKCAGGPAKDKAKCEEES